MMILRSARSLVGRGVGDLAVRTPPSQGRIIRRTAGFFPR